MDLVLHCAIEDPVVAQLRGAVLTLLAPLQSILKPFIIVCVPKNALKRIIRGAAGTPQSARQPALSSEALAFLRAKPATLQKQDRLS
jgi:hypothetical protein